MSLTSKVLLGILVALVVGIVGGKLALSRSAATGAAAGGAASHGHHGTATAVDWTSVSSRDLDIAEVFVIARHSGVGPALEKLEQLAANDTAIRGIGHIVAHRLGRFVVEERHGDPAVYSDCREVFQSGCNHGVMEGYFASARAAGPDGVAASTLDSLCARITRPGAARLVALECAHGMGHGLVVRYDGDLRQALVSCDHLTQRDARTECHDGVFMENAVRATTPGASAHQQRPLVGRRNFTYPCGEVDQAYQDACWKYQAIIMFAQSRLDEARIIDACARAPEAFRGDCFFGIGKQSTAWWENPKDIAQLCEKVPAMHGGACVRGVVESYLDEMWTVDRAMDFCRVVSHGAKAGCYEAIGARLAVMRTDYPTIERECATAEESFIPACVKGVALVWLRR